MSWYMPRFWHGMRLSTWLRELGRNSLAVSPSRVPMTCAVTGFTALNSVLAGDRSRGLYGRKVEATELAAPPVFILGHWRSGTTFLHELMIRDPEHTYFTTYQCFTPHHFVLTERKVVPVDRRLRSRTPADGQHGGRVGAADGGRVRAAEPRRADAVPLDDVPQSRRGVSRVPHAPRSVAGAARIVEAGVVAVLQTADVPRQSADRHQVAGPYGASADAFGDVS
jgi:hypothetical protein